MAKLLAIDLFAGGGGACLGMQQAGFEVVGIDIEPHPNYPGHFIQADIHDLPVLLEKVDFIWASPPCTAFSIATSYHKKRKEYPNLIPITRKLLKGHPWTCIENVVQAPIRQNLILWGQQFDLYPTAKKDGLWRKRAFELSFWAWNLPVPHMKRGHYHSIAGSMGCNTHFYRRKAKGLRGTLTTEEGKETMGIPLTQKMTRQEIVQSVPPAYARYIATEAIIRMKETGYVGVQERKERPIYKRAHELVSAMTEVPF